MLKNLNWPGVVVIVALISAAVGLAIFSPPEILREVIGGEALAILLAWFISRKRADKRADKPDEGGGDE